MSATTSPPDEEKKGRAGTNISVILMCLLLYFLSVGPVAVVVQTIPGAGPPIRMIYAPITWLHDHVRPLQKPIENYLIWWKKLYYRFSPP